MDSVRSTLLILAYYLNRNKISTEEYYSCIDSMIESLSNISIEIESSENSIKSRENVDVDIGSKQLISDEIYNPFLCYVLVTLD